MIELNLLERKAPVKLPTVLGVDLNTFNWKFLVVAILIYYIPGSYLESDFEKKITDQNAELSSLQEKEKKLNEELGGKEDIRSQLEAYNNQVVLLQERSKQVDNILKERTNPKALLEKIARSLTDEIWFDRLQISTNRELSISGGTYTPQGVASYRVLGQFIALLNDSPFFNGTVTLAGQGAATEDVDGVNLTYDKFEIKAQIKNYDAFMR